MGLGTRLGREWGFSCVCHPGLPPPPNSSQGTVMLHLPFWRTWAVPVLHSFQVQMAIPSVPPSIPPPLASPLAHSDQGPGQS